MHADTNFISARSLSVFVILLFYFQNYAAQANASDLTLTTSGTFQT
jgi:hypothetical protein